MGIAKSRMKRVAPVSVRDESVRSSGAHRDERRLFDPPDSSKPSAFSAQADWTSEGRDSEFSAEDLGEEVDRILAECDSTGITLTRTLNEMPMFGSETSGLYYAKSIDSNNVYSFSDANKQTSNIHVKVRPPQDLMNCAKNTAAASAYGMGGGSSLSFPIVYDASEEDLMNTIERDFG